jgi:hypothetical protein
MSDRSPAQNQGRWPLPCVHKDGEIEDTARVRRLTEFATNVAHLADRRADLDLRRLIDDLHRDLNDLEEASLRGSQERLQ